MRRAVWMLTLAALTACSEVPGTGEGVGGLQPLSFGTDSNDGVYGLARYGAGGGGVYAVGGTFGDLYGRARGGGDAFIRSYTVDGRVRWTRQFGTAAFDVALGAAADAGGSAYVAGYTEGDLAGSRGGLDAVLRKYGPDGTLRWTRQYGGANRDVANEVAASGDHVYLTGEIRNLETDDSDAFLIRVAADGTRRWTRVFGTERPDSALDVATDAAGNAYVTGYTLGSLGAANGGGYDLFVRKYRPSGDVAWTRQLHLSSRDFGKALAVAGDALYLVGDFWQGDFEDLDVRVVKFSLAGAVLWDRRYGRVGDDVALDAATDGDALYLAGTTATAFAGTNRGQFDGYVVKLGADGSFLWGKRQGTVVVDETYGVAADAGSVYAAGSTAGDLGGTNAGGTDGFVRRLSAQNGSALWTD